MDYEKAYKEMVQRARELHEGGNALTKLQMEIVCPELAESEDERIRKKLIQAFKSVGGNYWGGLLINDILAYLEKQKEQKPNIEICPHSIKSKSYSEQKPAEWSEEDAEILNSIVVFVSGYADKRVVSRWVECLKSLRPQSHWKPTQKQIDLLQSFVSDSISLGKKAELKSIIGGLKQLKK